MRHSVVILVAGLLTAAMASGSAVSFSPGIPCVDVVGNNVPCTGIPSTTALTNSNDPTFNLANDPGVVALLGATGGGIFVVPGDVVLFETTNGNLQDQSTWSDVVQFSDGRGGSIATTFPDAEPVGILLPGGFTLSSNAVGFMETTTGTSSDSTDFTTYVAGSATYQIHSDCTGACELSDVETPEPSLMGLLGFGFVGLLAAVKLRSR
jgi:hypothetical protein